MYLEKEKSKSKDYVYSVYNILNPKVTLNICQVIMLNLLMK